MLKTYARDFVNIVLGLSNFQMQAGAVEQPEFWDLEEDLRTSLAKIEEYSSTFGLKAALSRIAEIKDQLAVPEETPLDHVLANVKELQRDIIEALDGERFLYIPPNRTSLWENEQLFSVEVFLKIPEATDDIYEAGSCLAAGRAGGTVYHCMGIMQAVFFKVGRELGCTIDLELDDWNTVTGKITKALDKRRTIAEAEGKAGDAGAYAQWKREETAYNELISDVNAVARAWRHPAAHYRQKYKIDQAEKILKRVEDFAKHAATLLTFTLPTILKP